MGAMRLASGRQCMMQGKSETERHKRNGKILEQMAFEAKLMRIWQQYTCHKVGRF